MQPDNPYQSPEVEGNASTKDESMGWLDWIAVGLCCLTPIVLFAAAFVLTPVYEEFEIDLPMATLWFIRKLWLIGYTIVCATFAIAVVYLKPLRRLITLGTVILTLFLLLLCAWSHALPLSVIIRDLNQ